jgi:hypothetical protein
MKSLRVVCMVSKQVHTVGRIEISDDWGFTGVIYSSMAEMLDLENNLGSLSLNPTTNYVVPEENTEALADALSLTHNDETLQKVRHSLSNVGLDEEQITTAIGDMQNRGLVFRERK